jgi:hypothetical protein
MKVGPLRARPEAAEQLGLAAEVARGLRDREPVAQ